MLNRVNEGAKVAEALRRVWRVRSLGINVKRVAYERIVVLNVRKKEIECNGN